jgi:ferritin-like metal-binding protein YciE
MNLFKGTIMAAKNNLVDDFNKSAEKLIESAKTVGMTVEVEKQLTEVSRHIGRLQQVLNLNAQKLKINEEKENKKKLIELAIKSLSKELGGDKVIKKQITFTIELEVSPYCDSINGIVNESINNRYGTLVGQPKAKGANYSKELLTEVKEHIEGYFYNDLCDEGVLKLIGVYEKHNYEELKKIWNSITNDYPWLNRIGQMNVDELKTELKKMM